MWVLWSSFAVGLAIGLLWGASAGTAYARKECIEALHKAIQDVRNAREDKESWRYN